MTSGSDSSTPSPACPPGMMLHARQHIAKVMAVRQLAKDTWAVKVDAAELGATITPGQFFMIRPLSGSDPLLGRPFASLMFVGIPVGR